MEPAAARRVDRPKDASLKTTAAKDFNNELGGQTEMQRRTLLYSKD
jgi:hypothetical protein